MDWKDWIGKRIFVQLKSGTVYNGIINSCDEVFMFITDKKGYDVAFSLSDVSKIVKEEK